MHASHRTYKYVCPAARGRTPALLFCILCSPMVACQWGFRKLMACLLEGLLLACMRKCGRWQRRRSRARPTPAAAPLSSLRRVCDLTPPFFSSKTPALVTHQSTSEQGLLGSDASSTSQVVRRLAPADTQPSLHPPPNPPTGSRRRLEGRRAGKSGGSRQQQQQLPEQAAR